MVMMALKVVSERAAFGYNEQEVSGIRWYWERMEDDDEINFYESKICFIRDAFDDGMELVGYMKFLSSEAYIS